VAIIGFGAAAQAFVQAFKSHPLFECVAVVEPHPEVQAVARAMGFAVFNQLSDLKSGVHLDGVYIATPTPLHAPQTIECLEAGWHVLVEKPMASNAAEAMQMVQAAARCGKRLTVGHSHSFDAPIQAMRQIIERGELGAIQMVNTWCFTDWVYRPRRPEELNPALGGGVTFRQGAHQIDILRALCGPQVKSVKAKVFNSDPKRDTPGAHSSYLEFANGAAATAVYSGYGGMSSMDLTQHISEWGFEQQPQQRNWYTRSHSDLTPEQALQAKQQRARTAIPADAPYQPHFGLTVVNGSLGDMRQTPTGLVVSSASGDTHIQLSNLQSPRDLVLAELAQTWHNTGTSNPAWHDGQWGYDNLRVCEAAIESAQTGYEVRL
jgi:phthalate 4,5-cis-dihydrodiol dehydrogenase